jgi:membrane protein YqaA with SNARE-associated domain
MGAIFNPFAVALAAGSGATLGEISGYLVGFSGQGVIENKQWYDRISGWMLKFGDLTIFLLALIPNPFFDVAGMVAGALKMPIWRFLIWVWLGKFLKMLAFAYGGATFMGIIGKH